MLIWPKHVVVGLCRMIYYDGGVSISERVKNAKKLYSKENVKG